MQNPLPHIPDRFIAETFRICTDHLCHWIILCIDPFNIGKHYLHTIRITVKIDRIIYSIFIKHDCVDNSLYLLYFHAVSPHYFHNTI